MAPEYVPKGKFRPRWFAFAKGGVDSGYLFHFIHRSFDRNVGRSAQLWGIAPLARRSLMHDATRRKLRCGLIRIVAVRDNSPRSSSTACSIEDIVLSAEVRQRCSGASAQRVRCCFSLHSFCTRTATQKRLKLKRPPRNCQQREWAHEVAASWLADRERAALLAWRASVVSKRMSKHVRPTGANEDRRSAIRLRATQGKLSASAMRAMSAGIVRRCATLSAVSALSSPLASAEAASAVSAIS